jgi:hypothetical protein
VFLGKGDQFVKRSERHTRRLSGRAWIANLGPQRNDYDVELGTAERAVL